MATYRIDVSAGEVVFREGDPPTGAFLIESGSIEVSTTRFGARTVLSEIGPGALLGEMAVIDDSPHAATARALTDCVLTPIDRGQFADRLAAADPIVRALLLSQLGRYHSALATLANGVMDDGTSAMADDGASARDKIRLESELRSALDRGELEVGLQPIAELASGAIAGYEALARWPHPERGAVSPTEFIRLAEETSLIVPIGDVVLTRACDALVALRRSGQTPPPYISLNVSARQIDDAQWLDRLLAQLASRGLPADSLRIEITESLVLDQVRIRALLVRCHAAGMQVALDDFGTGYSNLAPLLALDFDQLKLDSSFVQALGRPRGLTLVEAILTMAAALGCDVIAEGVETVEQSEILRRLGCRYAQGWLVGKPLAVSDVLRDPQAVARGVG
ncbi:MAG TPA: EAL domain-containing protein [Rhodanobacteraceae bacterium]|nr:EAL domain-containing protein [Rhodanobacteraceae bacterium]